MTDGARKSVLKDSIVPFASRGLGLVVSFGLAIVLARALGLESFGVYSLVISVVMILSVPVQAGLPTLTVRETAKALATGQGGLIVTLMKWSQSLILGYFGLLFLVAAGVVWAIPAAAPIYLLGLLALPFSALMLRNTARMRGASRFTAGVLPEVLMRPAIQLILFVGAGLFVAGRTTDPVWAVAIYVISFAVAWGTSVVLLRQGAQVSDAAEMRPHAWTRSLMLLTVVGGGQVFFGHIDTLALGVFGTPEMVGGYRAALQISMLMIFVLTVVNQILQPRYAALYTKRDFAAMQRLAAESSTVMFALTLVPATIVIVFAGPILDLLFGPEFRVATLALQILVAGQCLNVFFGSVGSILNMTGYERYAMRGMFIAIAVNLVLDVALIPIYGIEGAATASALSICVWNVLLRYYTNVHVGLESIGLIYFVKSRFSNGGG